VHVLFRRQEHLSRVVLSWKKTIIPLSHFIPGFFCEDPLSFARLALSDYLIFFLSGTTNFAMPFQALWTTFWLAMTSHKPISLTTRLMVNPTSLEDNNSSVL